MTITDIGSDIIFCFILPQLCGVSTVGMYVSSNILYHLNRMCSPLLVHILFYKIYQYLLRPPSLYLPLLMFIIFLVIMCIFYFHLINFCLCIFQPLHGIFKQSSDKILWSLDCYMIRALPPTIAFPKMVDIRQTDGRKIKTITRYNKY